MKKIIKTTTILLAAILMLTAALHAQKSDKVIFMDGSAKEGKVTAFANEKVQFVHRGETLNYEFNKRDIEKIEYASGRTEVINEKRIQVTYSVPASSRNKVAVMPMTYIGDGNDSRSDDMRFYLQDIVISYLSKSAAELKFMDATEINAILLKNGIDDANIRQFTPKELAAILHAEYVITGSVLQDKGNVITVSNNTNTRKETVDRWGHDVKVTKRNNNHGSTVTRQDVETQVTLSIFNETGEKIYTKSRHSLLSEQDAYKNTITYLLKRTPLYRR